MCSTDRGLAQCSTRYYAAGVRRSYTLVPLLSVRGIAFEALFVTATVALPLLSHALGWPGAVWLPMHWGVLAASIVVGPLAGAGIGLVAPLANSLLTGLPPAMIVPAMTLELAIYGFVPGFVLRRFGRNDRPAIGTALLVAAALVAGQFLGRAGFLAGILASGAVGPALALRSDPAAFVRSAFVPGLFAALAQVVVLSGTFAAAHRGADRDGR